MTAAAELEAGARATVFTLLSHFLLREVDKESLEVLRQDNMLEVLDKLEPGCRASLEREWTESDFDQLAAEYCRLFILPGGVSPFANVWLSSTNPQAELDTLASRIVQLSTHLGLEAPDRRQPPTHIGWLLALAGLAEQSGPEAELERRVLYEQLLHPWVPKFCDALEKQARAPLYRALASLLRQVIA